MGPSPAASSRRRCATTGSCLRAAPSEIDLAATEHYVYSGLAGRTSQVRTSLNTSGYEWHTSFGYDALGDVSSITYPNCVSGPCQGQDSPRTVNFSRTRGHLTSVPGFASSSTYHDNGMVASVTHANNVVDTQTVDPSGRARPGSLTSKLGSSTLWSSGAYSYDGSGNITGMGLDWYVYDPLGRLSESSQRAANGQTYAQTFDYDRFGNLLAMGPRTFGVDSSTNRLTTASYDASGAVTSWAGQTFERDPFDMVRASEDWIYIYGPGDERLWTIHAPTPQGSTWTETYTLRGLGAEVLREYQLVGGTVSGTWTVERDTVHRDGRVLAVVSPIRDPAREPRPPGHAAAVDRPGWRHPAAAGAPAVRRVGDLVGPEASVHRARAGRAGGGDDGRSGLHACAVLLAASGEVLGVDPKVRAGEV